MIDKNGMLFGKINVVDFIVLLVIVLSTFFVGRSYQAVKKYPILRDNRRYILFDAISSTVIDSSVVPDSPYFKFKDKYPELFSKRYKLLEI